MRKVHTRVLVAGGLLVALVLAGFLSFYASDRPDGLERVAEDQGFADRAEEHPAADGPLADYRTDGVRHDRLSGGVAGVTGAVVVLVIVSGATYALRRRGDRADTPDQR